MKAEDLFFEFKAEVVKKCHIYYYINGGKNSLDTYLFSKVDQ